MGAVASLGLAGNPARQHAHSSPLCRWRTPARSAAQHSTKSVTFQVGMLPKPGHCHWLQADSSGAGSDAGTASVVPAAISSPPGHKAGSALTARVLTAKPLKKPAAQPAAAKTSTNGAAALARVREARAAADAEVAKITSPGAGSNAGSSAGSVASTITKAKAALAKRAQVCKAGLPARAVRSWLLLPVQ